MPPAIPGERHAIDEPPPVPESDRDNPGRLQPGIDGLRARHRARGGQAVQATRATETRNTCTYCSVACGILMYSLGDGAKNAEPSIFHIEGDPDHPVNRGTPVPEGRRPGRHHPQQVAPALPRVPRAGLERVEAAELGRCAGPHRAADEGRPRCQLRAEERGRADGQPLATGMLAASATSNETAVLTHKVVRSLGMLAFDNQARF